MPVFDEKAKVRQQLGETKESRHEKRYRTLANHIQSLRDTVADDNGRPTTSLLAQMGSPMSCDEMIKRLRKCNRNFVFERSIRYPELTGIYILTHEQNAAGSMVERKIHVCGMESGMMPEFTVRHTKTVKVPDLEIFGTTKPVESVEWKYVETMDGITKGWRAVLSTLLEKQLITPYHIQKYWPSPTHESENWYKETQ